MCGDCEQPIITEYHLYHYKYDIDAVERVQRRFTKRLPGLSNYTYNERLSFLNIPSLEQRRMHADLILCYKMLFGHLNICSVDFFLKLDQQA